MVTEYFFAREIFADFILPGILVFTILFAILEKTNVLGEGKRQINAIIAVVCAFILLAFEVTKNLIVELIPIMAVIAIIIFTFLLLFGFVSGDKKGDPLGKGVKIGFGIAIAIAIAITILVLTDNWDKLLDYLKSSNTGTSIIFIVISAAAVIAVLWGKVGGDKKD